VHDVAQVPGLSCRKGGVLGRKSAVDAVYQGLPDSHSAEETKYNRGQLLGGEADLAATPTDYCGRNVGGANRCLLRP